MPFLPSKILYPYKAIEKKCWGGREDGHELNQVFCVEKAKKWNEGKK